MCTWGDTVIVEIPGRIFAGEPAPDASIDRCIAPLVRALNEAGFRTVASCCGHGHRPGNIMLADGRELVIAPDFETARHIDRLFPLSITGERVGVVKP